MPLSILGLSGSLRADSLNTRLLHAAASHLPSHADFVLHDYADVPLYNGDLAEPASVARLKDAIAGADAVWIAVPEYNHGVPGVLKNAIDWVSRPAYASCFRDKPTGVMSAAASFVGGARGQQHLKVILSSMATPVFPWPELLVGRAHQVLVDGEPIDDTTTGFLSAYVEGFVSWAERTKLT